jgi:hypothetical protein
MPAIPASSRNCRPQFLIDYIFRQALSALGKSVGQISDMKLNDLNMLAAKFSVAPMMDWVESL